jgi:putative oxidoreductase
MEKPKWIFVLAGTRAILALTLLRVVVGGIMFAHGIQKLMAPGHFVDSVRALKLPVPELLGWLAIVAEVAGGLGLMVGLLTSVAALGVAFTMFVAVASVHLKNGLFAAHGGFEYPLTLLCVALFFIANGAGPLSIDGLLRARLQAHEQPGHAAPSQAAYEAARAVGADIDAHERVDSVTEAGLEPAGDPPPHPRRVH